MLGGDFRKMSALHRCFGITVHVSQDLNFMPEVTGICCSVDLYDYGI
jgi:hypothetical protein